MSAENQEIKLPDTATPVERLYHDGDKIPSRQMMINLLAGIALSTTTVACSSFSSPETDTRYIDEIASLQQRLENCDDLHDFQKNGGILSEGTLGVRRLYHDRPNVFRISRYVPHIDQSFMLWPTPLSADAITVEGDPDKLSAVQFGSYWGVQFKADYEEGVAGKEAFVIQNSMVKSYSDLAPGNPGIHRYVIIIERR